jgi:hypothetical protein
MNCTEFEICLNEQFAASRLAETPDLAEHAEQCALCRAVLERFRHLSDSLEPWRTRVPEVDLTQAVVVGCVSQLEFAASPLPAGPSAVPRARADDSRRPVPPQHAGIIARPVPPLFRISRTVWLAAGSLAAVVVAAVLISGVGNGPPVADLDPQIAAKPVPMPVAPAAMNHSVSRLDPPAEVREPLPIPQRAMYDELAQKAAGALNVVTAFVTTGGAVSQSADPGSVREDAEGWMDGLEKQLRPIGRGLDDAFDFLWQAGQSADNSRS